MKERILSTIGLWVIIIAVPVFLGSHGAALLLLVFGMATLHELLQILQKCNLQPLRTATMVCGAVLLIGSYIGGLSWLDLAFSIGISTVLLCILTLFRAAPGTIIPTAAASLFALLLVPATFSFAGVLLARESILVTVWIIVVAKFADVGALLVGMRFGKTLMAPRFSPKKTWEGLAGGLITSMVLSSLYVLIFSHWLPPAFNPMNALWMALPVAAAAVLSDLFESALKREAKIKDSGSTIPGIGGIFDLTDSFMFAFPTGFAVLQTVL